MERNDLPINILLQCPLLVDANDPQKIQDYLDLYNSGMEGLKDIAKSVDIKDNEES
jgi:hypothetical protein